MYGAMAFESQVKRSVFEPNSETDNGLYNLNRDFLKLSWNKKGVFQD